MDKELQEYYEESFDTFSSKGWKYFIEDMETLLEALNDFETVDNVEYTIRIIGARKAWHIEIFGPAMDTNSYDYGFWSVDAALNDYIIKNKPND